MGATLDFWRRQWSEAFSSEPTQKRDAEDGFSALTDALYALIAERSAAFTLADARRLPAVVRAKSLLMATAASFQPLAYRGGEAMPVQPRIVSRPDPFRPRWEFVSQTVDSLIEYGCAIWRLTGSDDLGRPTAAMVLNHDEVTIDWDERRFQPVYRWRSMPLPASQVRHIAIGRRAGELHGRGPLNEVLPYLGAIKAAEDYAREWFDAGGIPPVVLKSVSGQLTQTEATAAKSQWVTSREDGGATPVVFGKDWDIQFPPVNPQSGQMQEARSYGATVVATALGIPATLLHVQTSGATISYVNAAGALEELVKSTLAPQYLSPIEAAWTEMTPATQVVRFDLNDMQRADIAARFNLYAQAIAGGWMSVEEARASEGWGAATEAGHAFDPIPEQDPPRIEVPAA